jgi:hypothetical protein
MLKRWLSFGAVTAGMAVILVGCGGGFSGAQRAPWRSEAELACMRSGVLESMPYISQARAIEGPGVCGADYPLKVAGFTTEFTGSIGGSKALATGIKPAATLACPMVPSLSRWLNDVAQPAALEWLGQPVVEIRTMGSYACRSRNNQRGAKLSEHSFANAIDIGGFRLADGRVINVKGGWKGDIASQGFLKTAHRGACGYFKTVLGPGSDAFHHDHFHFDLARHGRSKSAYCRPRNVAIPQKPYGYDPSMAASYSEDATEQSYDKPAPGPRPLQDESYEQEPDLSALDIQQ